MIPPTNDRELLVYSTLPPPQKKNKNKKQNKRKNFIYVNTFYNTEHYKDYNFWKFSLGELYCENKFRTYVQCPQVLMLEPDQPHY